MRAALLPTEPILLSDATRVDGKFISQNVSELLSFLRMGDDPSQPLIEHISSIFEGAEGWEQPLPNRPITADELRIMKLKKILDKKRFLFLEPTVAYLIPIH